MCTKHRRLRRTYDSDATDWKRKHKTTIYKQKSCNAGEYSRLSLDGHLYKTDNSVKRTLKGAVSRQSGSFCLILPIARPQLLWNLK